MLMKMREQERTQINLLDDEISNWRKLTVADLEQPPNCASAVFVNAFGKDSLYVRQAIIVASIVIPNLGSRTSGNVKA